MIIRSNFVGDDPNRTRHLLDAENNELVVERTDLDRGCPADLDLMLRMCSALRASNPRAMNSVAHIKCSPFLRLNGEKGLLRLIEVVEREHGIPTDQPRKVFIHKKGKRVAHVHLLYAAVNPKTGRVLSSKLNYRADELASRILELEFGEQIVPGPRLRKNEEALIERGEHAMAAALSKYEPVRNYDRDPENERQQGSRTKMPLMEFRRRLANALSSTGSPMSLPRALDRGEFAIAKGDRRDVLMVVHLKTGTPYSLNRVMKGMPQAFAIADEDIRMLETAARPVADVVRAGLVVSYRRAEARVDSQVRRGVFEAAVHGGRDPLLDHVRRQRAAAPPQDDIATMTLKAYRAAIRNAEKLAQTLQQRRIDRAFRVLRVLQSPRAQKAAFAFAASGSLLAGASFALAVGAGVLATVVVMDRARQQRTAVDMLISNRWQRAAGPQSQHHPRPATAAPAPTRQPKPRAFDFDGIPREQRVLAGIVLSHKEHGWDTSLAAASARALGAAITEGLLELHRVGSEKQKATVITWAKGKKHFAAASALRRAGEHAAAAEIERQGRRVAASRAPGRAVE